MKLPCIHVSNKMLVIRLLSSLPCVMAFSSWMTSSFDSLNNEKQLKYDGFTSAAKIPWSLVIIPGLSVAFVMLVLWTSVHYVNAGSDLNVRWTNDIIRVSLTNLSADDIEVYHERYLFRDVMLVMAFVMMTAYAGLVNSSACGKPCDVPFHMFSTVLLVSNAVRIAAVFLRSYFEYHRLRLLASELRYYKSWRDDSRFRERVVPLLAFRFGFNFYSVIEGAFFICSALLLALATVWVETDACIDSCPKTYQLTKYLVLAVYAFESGYLLSVLALVYFRRTSGLERAELMIEWIVEETKRRELIEKGELLRPV